MGYLKKSVISVTWVSAFRVCYRLLSVVRTVILARLLTPIQFGDFGIASLVLALVEIFTETGINVFLVQQEDDEAIVHYLDTAWVISIFRGLLISLLVLISSIPVSQFFNNAASKNLILLMALVPLVRGFINPAEAKFQKHLKFDQEFLFRMVIALVDAAVALTVAFIYRTPISLIAGLIAGALVEVMASFMYLKPTPHLHFNNKQAKEIIGSGKWVTGAGIASYFSSKGVDISIGRLVSTNALGIYQMAYKFSVMFVDELVEMVNRVAFPVYVRIGGDRRRLKRAFLRTSLGFILTVTLLMGAVALFAGPIVTLLLGPNWVETTKYLQLLSLVGFAIALSVPTNPLFLAVKQQRYLNNVVVVQLIIFIAAIIPAILHPSLDKIIYASVTSLILSLPLRMFYAYKIFSSNQA